MNALAKAGIELGENGYLPKAEGEAALIKGALTEANYCWPAVSVCSCLIAAFR